MQLSQVIFCSLGWILPESTVLQFVPGSSIHWIEMPAEFTALEQVNSCGSVSCLINMEPLELLRLQPSEPIASDSMVDHNRQLQVCFVR